MPSDQERTPEIVIAQAIFDYFGNGQGVDDMLAEIAQGEARAIVSALTDAGFRIVKMGAVADAR